MRMQLRLYDDDGADTRFGSTMRTSALLIAILSGILFLASPLLFLAGAGTCLVGCTDIQWLFGVGMLLSPLLFLMAMAAGFSIFNGNRLSAKMIAFMFIAVGTPIVCTLINGLLIPALD